MTVHCWGEKAEGEWTLEVQDIPSQVRNPEKQGQWPSAFPDLFYVSILYLKVVPLVSLCFMGITFTTIIIFKVSDYSWWCATIHLSPEHVTPSEADVPMPSSAPPLPTTSLPLVSKFFYSGHFL